MGLARLLLGIALLYAVYAAAIFFFQRSLLYPGASRRASPAPPLPARGVERHWIAFSSGRVEAWYLPPEREAGARAAPALLWVHGNGELIDDWEPLASDVRALGLGILLVEYPGYGRSSGKPSEAAITEAAIAAYDLLAARADVDAGRIAAFGRSLGAGAACAVARARPVAALVLQAAFTSVRSFAKRYLVPGFLARDVFDNLRALPAYAGPVLLLHGKQDEVVPYAHALELLRAARSARLVTFDCAHNDFPFARLPEEIAAFLREAGVFEAEAD